HVLDLRSRPVREPRRRADGSEPRRAHPLAAATGNRECGSLSVRRRASSEAERRTSGRPCLRSPAAVLPRARRWLVHSTRPGWDGAGASPGGRAASVRPPGQDGTHPRPRASRGCGTPCARFTPWRAPLPAHAAGLRLTALLRLDRSWGAAPPSPPTLIASVWERRSVEE